MGVHNRTNGIIFDLIEVMVQRCLNVGTSDVRLVYKELKKKLYDDRYDTVIFILREYHVFECNPAINTDFLNL